MRGPGLVLPRLVANSRRILLDTSAVIYFLTGLEPYASKVLVPLLSRIRDGEAHLFLSVVTEAELLVRPNRTGDTAAIEQLADFLSEDGIYVVEVDRQIARMAAAVRTTNRIGLPDAMIIATGIALGCDVIVGNDKGWAGRTEGVRFVLLDDLV